MNFCISLWPLEWNRATVLVDLARCCLVEQALAEDYGKAASAALSAETREAVEVSAGCRWPGEVMDWPVNGLGLVVVVGVCKGLCWWWLLFRLLSILQPSRALLPSTRGHRLCQD